jgi:hypothetical protein
MRCSEYKTRVGKFAKKIKQDTFIFNFVEKWSLTGQILQQTNSYFNLQG